MISVKRGYPDSNLQNASLIHNGTNIVPLHKRPPSFWLLYDITYSTTKRVKEPSKGRIPIAFLKVELRHNEATDRSKVESFWFPSGYQNAVILLILMKIMHNLITKQFTYYYATSTFNVHCSMTLLMTLKRLIRKIQYFLRWKVCIK